MMGFRVSISMSSINVFICALFIFTELVVVVVSSTECSRGNSRIIRTYLNNELFPVMMLNTSKLSLQCGLNPMLDVYGLQELAKVQETPGEWKCTLCNKKFVDEFYIDKHLENTHSDVLKTTEPSICLADLCPIFGCTINNYHNEYIHNGELSSRKRVFGSLEKCDSVEVGNFKQECLNLSQECFGGINSRNGRIFTKEVCEQLKCVNGVMKGGLQVDKDNNTRILLWILSGLGILIILAAALMHVLFADINVWTLFGWHIRGGVSSEDYLANFRSKTPTPSNNFWFFATIKTAFVTLWKDAVRMYKYKGKSH